MQSAQDKYFMNMAKLASRRCRGSSAGACIASDDDKFVGAGFDSMPLNKNGMYNEDMVCHAEMNAIVQSNRTDFTNCRMYVTRMPCNVCSKLIVQNNIKKVIYLSSEDVDEISRNMFLLLEEQDFELRSINETDLQVEC